MPPPKGSSSSQRRQPPRPCHVCSVPPSSDPSNARVRHVHLRDMVRSRKKGCQFCFAVTEAIAFAVQPLVPPGDRANDAVQFLSQLEHDDGSHPCTVDVAFHPRKTIEVGFHVNLLPYPVDLSDWHLSEVISGPDDHLDVKGRYSAILELFCDYGSAIPWEFIKPAPHVPLKLKPSCRRSLIGKWIQDCVKGHTTCRPSASADGDVPSDVTGCVDGESHTPPKRLLDLRGNPRNSIRLVDSSGVSDAYATVTHGWQSYPLLPLLNRKNLVQRMDRMSWADLPSAFQDAILVAVEQNIRYLWIDALCIVQDDPADQNWHAEHMVDIYSHSLVNISLIRSWDVRHPVLAGRWMTEKRVTRPHHTRIDISSGGKKYPVYARPAFIDAHSIIHYPDRKCHPWSFSNHPHSRDCLRFFGDPWAVLALIIAPRTVHFHVSELIWQCRSSSRCECSPSPHLDGFYDPSIGECLPKIMAKFRALPGLGTNSASNPKPLADWKHLSGILSVTQSKNKRSRVQAIAALARWFQPRIRKDYIAGLFANTTAELCHELLWVVRPVDFPDPITYRNKDVWAPSWSWLSLQFPMAGGFAWQSPQSDFACHPRLQIHSVTSRTQAGVAENHPPFHTSRWALHVCGELLNVRISIRREHDGYGYPFAPANTSHFPGEHRPPPYACEPSGVSFFPETPYVCEPSGVPFLPEPPPGYQEVGNFPEFDPKGFSPSVEASFWPPESVYWADLQFSLGSFFPDCGIWDNRRKASVTKSRTIPDDGTHPFPYTYAYLLRLGTIFPPPPMFECDYMDGGQDGDAEVETGLVLVLAPDAGPNAFRRVGIYYISSDPRVSCGPWTEAQVQDITLV